MAVTLVNLTFDVADILGADFDARRTKVWIETNVEGDVVIDSTNNLIRLGDATATVGTDGTGSFVGLVATDSTTNPTAFQYRVWIDYARAGHRDRAKWDSGWFSLTATSDLADVVAEQYAPAVWQTTFMTDAQALLDQQEAVAGLTGEDAAVEYLIENPSLTKTALEASIADATVGVRRAPLVADLIADPPIAITHRGAANLWPEGVLASYEAALTLGLPAMEVGDFRALPDGGIFDCHDATVDRITNGTGNFTDFSTPGMMKLTVDASSFYSASYSDQVGLSDLGQILTRIGGRTVAFVEVKDLLDSTAVLIANKIRELGLEDSVVLSSFTRSNLEVPEADGLYKAFYAGAIPGDTPSQLIAAGVNFYALNHRSAGEVAGNVAAMKAAGLIVYAYTVDKQSDFDTAMSKGFDGIFSNDPLYAPRLYSKYRRAATTWHKDGAFSHGMAHGGDGPYVATQRGYFVGQPGAYRWQPARNAFLLIGPVSPVPNPSGSYTITAKTVIEAVPITTTQGPDWFVCAADDLCTNIAGSVPSSYSVKVRANGTLQAWAVNAAGTATSLGSIATTAFSIPTLSSGLTAGAAITSIPVNALTVALKVGHQFVLPTGQVVTLAAAAAIGATSLTVSSVTPSAAVSSGANLLPQVTVTIAVTPTGLTIARADEASVSPLVSSDTTQRGAYIYAVNYMDTGNASFPSVAVA